VYGASQLQQFEQFEQFPQLKGKPHVQIVTDGNSDRKRVSALPAMQKRERMRDVYFYPTIPYEPNITPSAETVRLADELWPQIEPHLTRQCLVKKREEWQRLVHHCRQGASLCRLVAYSRKKNRAAFSATLLDVIEAAESARLIEDFRAKPGSPVLSRLRPTAEMIADFAIDPWLIERPQTKGGSENNFRI
jgi:hypothetical protein